MQPTISFAKVMTKTFNCASCSAPLEFEGTMMQKCRYCGSTVIAPHDMFYAGGGFADLSSLSGRALKIAEINELVHDGKKLEAIKLFRETFGVGLDEAKNAVERMERGESVDISGMQITTSRKATPAVNGAIGGSTTTSPTRSPASRPPSDSKISTTRR